MGNCAPPFLRRSVLFAAAAALVAVLTACTGTGGGQLPPASPAFTAAASFGFDFSCERSTRSTSPNSPTGRLRIELSYTDHGINPLGAPFGIHGFVDKLDPVLESAICIGQNAPPGGNELIFLGRYRLTSSAPAALRSCPARETSTTPLCRFEVIVRDNDQNRAPSKGDFFSIKLTTATALSSEFPDDVFVAYARAGLLESGNITVD